MTAIPTTPAHTARTEEPVYFPSGDHQLFGVFTRPAEPNGSAVLLIKGGSPNLVSFQRNRLAVRMARSAAELGYHVLRFDWHGVGESGGPTDVFRLDRPFGHDEVAAVKWLQAQGFSRVFLVGSCYGGRAALMAAQELDGVDGVALIAMSVAHDLFRLQADNVAVSQYVRSVNVNRLRALFDRKMRRAYARRLRDKLWAVVRRRWARLISREPIDPTLVSRDVLKQLIHLLEGGTPVLFLYGTEDPFYEHFQRVTQGNFGSLLARYGDLVEVSIAVDGVLHEYASIAAQDGTVEAVEQWLSRRRPAARSNSMTVENVEN